MSIRLKAFVALIASSYGESRFGPKQAFLVSIWGKKKQIYIGQVVGDFNGTSKNDLSLWGSPEEPGISFVVT